MKSNAFFVADHAEAINGKLYVTGGCWDRITAQNFPAVHNHLSVVFSITIPWQSTNEKHRLEILFEDSEGQSQLPGEIKGEFEAGRPPGWRPGDDATLVGVFNINGLKIEKPGRYSFALQIDGSELARTVLLGVAAKVPTQTG